MSADKVWVCCNAADDYVEFERTLEGFGPPGDECRTSVDMRITFVLKQGLSPGQKHPDAYVMLLKYDDEVSSPHELLSDDEGQIKVSWEEGLRLLGDTPLPEELK